MARLTIVLALIIAGAGTAYLAVVRGSVISGTLLSIPQWVAFGVIAGTAWCFRQHGGSSWTIFATLVPAAWLSWLYVRMLYPPIGMGVFTYVCLYMIAQMWVVVLGCYLGYVFVERERLQPQNPGSDRGRLVVVCLLAIVAVAVIGYFAIAF